MTQKHTPTPWIQDGMDIVTADGEHIATTLYTAGFLDSIPYEHNAAHIVKCVNMHDELVEALKLMMTEDSEEAWDKAREALKKAGAL